MRAQGIIEPIARELNQTAEQKTSFRKYWDKRIRSALRIGVMKHRLARQNRCSPFHTALCDIHDSQRDKPAPILFLVSVINVINHL